MDTFKKFCLLFAFLIIIKGIDTTSPPKFILSKAAIHIPSPDDEKPNKCECGAFDDVALDANSKPILSQKLITVTCDEKGIDMCNQLCNQIAQLAQNKGSSILCAHFQHADRLKVFAFSRVCNQPTWTYTGISSDDEICCHDMKLEDCQTGYIATV